MKAIFNGLRNFHGVLEGRGSLFDPLDCSVLRLPLSALSVSWREGSGPVKGVGGRLPLCAKLELSHASAAKPTTTTNTTVVPVSRSRRSDDVCTRFWQYRKHRSPCSLHVCVSLPNLLAGLLFVTCHSSGIRYALIFSPLKACSLYAGYCSEKVVNFAPKHVAFSINGSALYRCTLRPQALGPDILQFHQENTRKHADIAGLPILSLFPKRRQMALP